MHLHSPRQRIMAKLEKGHSLREQELDFLRTDTERASRRQARNDRPKVRTTQPMTPNEKMIWMEGHINRERQAFGEVDLTLPQDPPLPIPTYAPRARPPPLATKERVADLFKDSEWHRMHEDARTARRQRVWALEEQLGAEISRTQLLESMLQFRGATCQTIIPRVPRHGNTPTLSRGGKAAASSARRTPTPSHRSAPPPLITTIGPSTPRRLLRPLLNVMS